VKAAARSLTWQLVPSLMAERAREYERSLRVREGVVALSERFVDIHGSTVLHGPCAGLSYPRRLLDQVDAPIAKLLGVYEQELHPVLSEIVTEPPRTIVDLGAAEGYYAVGLARACKAPVIAFELARSARLACRELAAENSVKLQLGGKATASRVRKLPLDGAFVLCDVEGAEATVLDQPTADAMRHATVIIELHEHKVPGITNIMRERFTAHDCTIVHEHPRDLDRPELEVFTLSQRDLAVSESRWRGHDTTWAVFCPRG
jgi:predicted RNA methylase